MHGGREFREKQTGGGDLPIFLIGKALKPFISKEWEGVATNPILGRASEGAAARQTKRIFDMLRERGEIGSHDVAVKAMRDKGLDPDHDPATRTDFVRRVGLQLNDMQRKGKIERI